jgi:hypothetical protein
MKLSKQSWIGGVVLAVFGYLASGFFGSVGSDIHSRLKIMAADFSYDFITVFIVFTIIGMGFGIALIVHDIYKHRNKLPRGAFHPRLDDESRRRDDDRWRFFPSNVR